MILANNKTLGDMSSQLMPENYPNIKHHGGNDSEATPEVNF